MSDPQLVRMVQMWAPVEPVVERARELAADQRSARVMVAHLAAALFEVDSVAAVAEACGVDVDLAHDVALGTSDELPRRRWWQLGPRVDDRELTRLYNGALLHAMSAEIAGVSPELLLVHVLARDPSSRLAARLDALGLELLDVRRVIAHGATDDPPLPEGIGPGRVRVVNDPFTPFELVTHIFEACFGLAADRAERLMIRVHERGDAAFPFEDWERARRQVIEARTLSRARGYPLRMSLETRSHD